MRQLSVLSAMVCLSWIGCAGTEIPQVDVPACLSQLSDEELERLFRARSRPDGGADRPWREGERIADRTLEPLKLVKLNKHCAWTDGAFGHVEPEVPQEE